MEQDVLQKQADTLTNATVKIKIDYQPTSIWDKIKAKIGKVTFTDVYEIKPLCLGTMIRISKELLAIDLSIFDKNNFVDSNYQTISLHTERLARIIALAINNNQKPLDTHLVQVILSQFTAKDLFQVLSVVIKQMDMTSFMSSIVSVKGLNVLNLETSRPTAEELIASGDTLAGL